MISLLNEEDQMFLNYHINNNYDFCNKMNKLYFELKELIIDDKSNNKIKLDIKYNNKNYNSSYLNKKRLYNNFNENLLNNFSLVYNNNNKIDEKIISIDFYNNNNISDNCYDFVQDNNQKFKNKKKDYFEMNNNSIELKEDTKELNISKYLKDYNKSFNQKRNKFKSRYIGVTKNKKKWQVYIRFNNKNTYLGTYSSEKTAAKIYDIMSIKKKGTKAKTNFKYSESEIKEICKVNNNINNIYKIAIKKNI